MKRLGTGGRVSGGWLRQGGPNASGRKKGRVQCIQTRKSASGPIGCASQRLDPLDAQVSVWTHWTGKSASGPIGRASQRLDPLDAALSLPDGMSPADAPRTGVYVISAWNVRRTG